MKKFKPVATLPLLCLASVFLLLRSELLPFQPVQVPSIDGSDTTLQIISGPYLQSPTDTSMTIIWITNRNATGWVDYGTEDISPRRAFNSHHGLIDANERIHTVTLAGLEPGMTYQYRVVSDDILTFEAENVTYGKTVASDWYHFQTLDRGKKNISFIVFNDLHENWTIVPKLLKLNKKEPYDLAFFNGDIINDIHSEQQIIAFLAPNVEWFAAERPFIYVRGNHETRGSFARSLPNYIASPNGNYYYSFDHGPVHFIILDGGEDKEDNHVEYSGLVDFDAYRDRQTEWLRNEINSQAFQTAKFRIVIVHMPFPRSSATWHGELDAYKKWGPYLNAGNVDLLISGHTHNYAILEPAPGRHDYPIIIGGSPREGETTLIRVDVTTSQAAITMIRDDGKVVGTYKVKARK